MAYEMEGVRPRVRPKKTWSEVVKKLLAYENNFCNALRWTGYSASLLSVIS